MGFFSDITSGLLNIGASIFGAEAEAKGEKDQFSRREDEMIGATDKVTSIMEGTVADIEKALDDTLIDVTRTLDEGTNLAIFGTSDKEEIFKILENDPGGMRNARDAGLAIIKEYETKAADEIKESADKALDFINEAKSQSIAAIKEAEAKAGRALDEGERKSILTQTTAALKAERALDDAEVKAIGILHEEQQRSRQDLTAGAAAAILAQNQGYAEAKGVLTPYLEAGQRGLGLIESASDFKVTELAGYQRELEEGIKQIDRAFASRGMRHSGANLEQVENFKRDLYTKYQQTEEARRERIGGTLADYGAGAGSQLAGLASNTAANVSNIYTSTAAGLANVNQGYATAAGNVAYGTGQSKLGLIQDTAKNISDIQERTGQQKSEVARGTGQGLRNVYMPAGAAAANVASQAGLNMANMYGQSGVNQANIVGQTAATEAQANIDWASKTAGLMQQAGRTYSGAIGQAGQIKSGAYMTQGQNLAAYQPNTRDQYGEMGKEIANTLGDVIAGFVAGGI
jgi:hypothetical protein